MRLGTHVKLGPNLVFRSKVLRVVFYLAFLGVLVRLFYWQVLQAERLQTMARNQYDTVQKVQFSRGRIFSAEGYPLVANKDVYTLFFEPKIFTASPSTVAAALAPILTSASDDESLASDAGRLQVQQNWEQTMRSRLGIRDLNWVQLKRKLPKEAKDSILQLGITGLGFDREEQRYYPEASMAAQILGFVGSNERGEDQGYFGIEGMFDRELRGREGEVHQVRDAVGAPIAIGGYDEIAARDGRDIVLTIHRDLQFMLEDQLQKGMEKYGSKTAEGLIMDPKTGAILAMASLPTYDPAHYYKYPPEQYKNLLAADLYEPGSTLKILTVATGIDAGVITPTTSCDNCAGSREISGYKIKTWNNQYTPNITMTEGLVHSDNTAMIFAEEKLGKDRFVEYLRKFGLDHKSGVDLQEEVSPNFRTDWKDIDAATASFGQGIAVNGVQMTLIAQTIANKGVMMRPMLVQSVRDAQEELPVAPRPVGQIISEATASQVTEMMVAAAAHGDAKWALPRGYRIAGKTGTAQVPVAGHYDDKRTIASFVGFAPADDPKFVMLVKLREPSTSQWGSETAAPLWFSIARELFLRMNIPPQM